MTKIAFRTLLLTYLASIVVAITVGMIQVGYSAELANAYANEPETWLEKNTWAFLGTVVPLLVASLVGWFGLFRFKGWGRPLSVYSTIGILLLLPFFGPALLTPLESVFIDISSMLWGFILALAYYSNVSALFSAKHDAATQSGVA